MYDPSKIEPKWQKRWEENKTFRAEMGATATDGSPKPKYYVLDMFPYPSGAGLHVGHPEGYTATDIICRHKRMKGFNVLHPMGWDAFGLPTENYAIKTGRPPQEVTEENIKTFKRQIQSLGFSYDWDREVDTTDPDYYRWTQWLFLRLYKEDLLYEKEMPMAWCPVCKTVVANEEVEQGTHERCGNKVERKNLKQWMFRITKYADRLLDDLDTLTEWPEPIVAMQRNWIGKSEGLIFTAPVKDTKLTVQTFSTHYEAFYADMFVVIAPDHPFLPTLLEGIPNKQEILDFCDQMIRKRNERGFEEEKPAAAGEGIFTGRYITDPIGNGDLPIWVASFALADYGTGIVKCSCHDERDFAFAKKYGIKLKPVLFPEDPKESQRVENLEVCYTDMQNGVLAEPAEFAGKKAGDLRKEIADYAEKKGFAIRKTQYRLRDWIFSRQRYWGEPIPLVKDQNGAVYPLDESELPLTLPKVEKYEPSGTGESPLANVKEWVEVEGEITKEGTFTAKKSGQKVHRETSTMPNWAGSSWYWLRFMDTKNAEKPFSEEAEKYWGPVDLYVGGAEHAVLHLLYSRFWQKALFDLGYVHTQEPFMRLMNQGLILGEDSEKMSKSRGNVVNPDDVIKQYGADTLRVYEMFMGPFTAVKPWSMKNIEGSFRFLQKVWKLIEEAELTDDEPSPELARVLHKTIKKVGEDIENFAFNTAISQMMILANDVMREKKISKPLMEKFVLILSPFAPHMAEELWEKLGYKGTLAYEPWPAYDPALVKDDTFELVFSVNGKVRGSKVVSVGIGKEEAIAAAREDEGVKRHLEGAKILKEIYVPGKLVNVVVG